jgi:uncharacterized protein YaaN involved in tellurite resistance
MVLLGSIVFILKRKLKFMGVKIYNKVFDNYETTNYNIDNLIKSIYLYMDRIVKNNYTINDKRPSKRDLQDIL